METGITEVSQLGSGQEEAHSDKAPPNPGKALSWIFLLGFLFVSSSARGVYSAHEVEPSLQFEALCFISGINFFWYWLREQCRPYRATFPLDLAWFVWNLWLFLFPYYLWRYERGRGILKVLIVTGAVGLSLVWPFAVHFVLSP